MSNKRQPRIVPAGAEIDDNDPDMNPFYLCSDDDNDDVLTFMAPINSGQSLVCSRSMMEDDKEDDMFYGSTRHGFDSGWGRDSDKGPGFGLKRGDYDAPYSDEENGGDPNPDRELKKFLRVFGVKDAYKPLHGAGITLCDVLKMEAGDFIQVGLGDEDKLPTLRRLLYAIQETHKCEWVQAETLAMTDKLLTSARRLTNSAGAHHMPESSADPSCPDVPSTKDDLKDDVEKGLRSVYQQVVSAKQLLGFMSSGIDYLCRIIEIAVTCNEESVEDIEETLVNAVDTAVVIGNLKDRLIELRKRYIAGGN